MSFTYLLIVPIQPCYQSVRWCRFDDDDQYLSSSQLFDADDEDNIDLLCLAAATQTGNTTRCVKGRFHLQ